MLTIVFYGSDGEAAKLRSREIAAHKPNKVRVYDAAVWNGAEDFCDAVEILPCVPGHRRALIESVFAGKFPAVEIPADVPGMDAVGIEVSGGGGSGGGGGGTTTLAATGGGGGYTQPTTRPRGRPRKVA